MAIEEIERRLHAAGLRRCSRCLRWLRAAHLTKMGVCSFFPDCHEAFTLARPAEAQALEALWDAPKVERKKRSRRK